MTRSGEIGDVNAVVIDRIVNEAIGLVIDEDHASAGAVRVHLSMGQTEWGMYRNLVTRNSGRQ